MQTTEAKKNYFENEPERGQLETHDRSNLHLQHIDTKESSILSIGSDKGRDKKEINKIETFLNTRGDSSDVFSFLFELRYPNDPANVEKFDIKINDEFCKLCCSIGPNQPVLDYPKNNEIRSSQKNWYENRAYLEYSVETDSMYCFSCHLFLLDKKYKTKRNWKSLGINKWRTALEKIKDHESSEAHMISMLRWNNFKKTKLKNAFEFIDKQIQAVNNEERQKIVKF